MKLRKLSIGTLLAVTVITLALGLPNIASRVVYALDSVKAGVSKEKLATAHDVSLAFEEVANVIKPSVVNITSARRISAPNSIRTLPDPLFRGPFREFFGDEFFDQFFHQKPSEKGYIQQGAGSGVIVSDDGYILTNNHVVDNADEVTVRLTDNRTFTAHVVGTDPKTDLAVVKINATGLYPASLGNSDKLRIGEWVLAVGNPFGLANTLTAGIVSATGRANMGIVEYEDFIQTDAAINPGNSGGPLVNLSGEVIGINTAIFTRSGGYMGIGFSIPVNIAKSILDDLIESGRVVRGWLGVLIQDLDDDLAKSFAYESTKGALVGEVTSNSPADEAGFREGDILVSYDGKKIENTKQLRSLVAQTEPGSKVAMEVFRDGKTERLHVKIGELEGQATSTKGDTPSDDLGMTVRTLTTDIAARLGQSDLKGVIVTEIDPLGPAAKAGIRANDVILKVHNRPVENVSGFREELKKHDLKKGVRLRIQSGSNQRYAFLKTGES